MASRRLRVFGGFFSVPRPRGTSTVGVSWTAEMKKLLVEVLVIDGEEDEKLVSFLSSSLPPLPLPSRKSTAIAPRVSGSIPRTMSATFSVTEEEEGGETEGEDEEEGTVATAASSIPLFFIAFLAPAPPPPPPPLLLLLLLARPRELAGAGEARARADMVSFVSVRSRVSE